jgi:hypothetical protein
VGTVVTFDQSFDGTDMTIEEIKMEARMRGWPGMRIDGVKFNETGILTVMRMSEKRVSGETR